MTEVWEHPAVGVQMNHRAEFVTMTKDDAPAGRFRRSKASRRNRHHRIDAAKWSARTRNGGARLLRYRYELMPTVVTTSASLLGMMQHGHGVNTALYAGLTGLSGAVGWIGGVKGHVLPLGIAGGTGCLVFGNLAVCSGLGPSWLALTSWALATATAYGVYVPWLIRKRNERMKLNVDAVKAKGPVAAAHGMDVATGLTGATAEETALRRALHALTGVAPQAVEAFRFDASGWTAVVSMPPGKSTSAESIVKRKTQLAANLGLAGDMDAREGGRPDQLIVRLTTSDGLAKTIGYRDDERTEADAPVRIGWDERGRPCDLTILYRHTLVAGASDWGKSGIVNNVIKKLVRRPDWELVGIDLKPGSPELGPWSPLFSRPVASTVAEARELLQWFLDEAQQRGELLEQWSQASMAAGKPPIRKWVPGKHGSAILLITDELAELIRQDEEEAKQRREHKLPALRSLADMYESALAIVRFLGMQILSATQTPSRRVFGGSTDARGNYANRISTRLGESNHAVFIFGADAASRGWDPQNLDMPGKFLISSAEHPEKVVYRSEYVTDQDIADDVAPHFARGYSRERGGYSVPQQATEEPTLPDGTQVRHNERHLWELFRSAGSMTKAELAEAAGIAASTAGLALNRWERHGVVSTREGRAERYSLPE